MALQAGELEIVLPLARTAYQTNEWIDVSVARRATEDLAGGSLELALAGEDGSQLAFRFAVPAVKAEGGEARRTEHLHVDGRLLRPGHYTIEVTADGATASTGIDVYSHVRRSSYRLICWGRAKGKDQLVEGQRSLGFNLFYGHYGRDDEANFLRAGVDFMSCCTMSGGHQMDLRAECDWSDPYVTRGGTRRVVQRAFIDRTRPNVLGVHFYDEPGLTWHKHPRTGEWTPHGLPSQVRSFESAFGRTPIPYYEVDPANPDHAARWRHWALWKLGFMDAAWKEAQFGVSYVRPDYLSVTQSQYGFTAFTDGYYFNVARSLPVVSGHGGYDDYGLGYFNPSYTLEMARARDFAKPCWYLPTWYGNTPSDRFRLEQYLSFVTDIQGMITPPDIDPFEPGSKPAAEGVVECNHRMARLGTIFTTMPVTRPPVAMLYSMSDNIHTQTGDMTANYAHASRQGRHLPFTYLAGKILYQPFMAVVEEDVVDGTLAAHHKAVVVTSVDYLDPKVVVALERFAADGGLVMLAGDCEVKIKGAVDLGVTPRLPEQDLYDNLAKEGKYNEARQYATVGKQLEAAAPLARAIRAQLERAGIGPVFTCGQPGILASRQAHGDVEYLFAVNATYDEAAGGWNAIRSAEATIGFAADGRPVYDAVLGGPVSALEEKDGRVGRRFRFGPGQMRAFARTARPIGSVQVLTPVVRRDYVAGEPPLGVRLSAVMLDDRGRPLCGSIPLRIRLLDPDGCVRYDLYRATDEGTLDVTLPLAVNDPPGEWTVTIEELLAGNAGRAPLLLPGTAQCAAMAGGTRRAVFFGRDCENAFRFFRVHHDVTIVAGSSEFNRPAAERLTKILAPWGVRCRTVRAEEVNRPRRLSEEEARTWVGIDFGRAKPGADNPVGKVGFDIDGPVVLLGNPDDNPLIRFIDQRRFLPYKPDPKSFPGPGRGMLAWQRDAVGSGQESITLIAYDADGINEAVGTLYEAAAGIAPLTKYVLPDENGVTPATNVAHDVSLPVVWTVTLPDRAAAMGVAEDGRLHVVTWDGTGAVIDSAGKIVSREVLPPDRISEAAQKLNRTPQPAAMEIAEKTVPPDRIVKHVAATDGRIAVAYWGGTVRLLDRQGNVLASQTMPEDVTALAWLVEKLVVGLSNGQIVALEPKVAIGVPD